MTQVEQSDEVRLVFDADAWGGKDVGDNSQFWRPATILWRTRNEHGEEVASVRFHHDDRTSHGHFTAGMRRV